MIAHDWKLTVEFGYEYDDAPGWTPEVEAQEVKRLLLKEWCIDEEDLEPGELVVDGATVTVKVDVLDYLNNVLREVIYHHIPKRLEILRED